MGLPDDVTTTEMPTVIDNRPKTEVPTETEPPTINPPTKPEQNAIPGENQETEDCPSLEGNMDSLTQDQFTNRLTHTCRYDKLVRPSTKIPLNVLIQIDLQHIEAVDQLVPFQIFY